jgi:3-oxoacyl-[acyl-carrier protein] reductase
VDISGKKVIVSGGSGELGSTLAGALVEQGATVTSLDRCSRAPDTLYDHLDCDLTDPVQVDQAIQTLDIADILVNCVGRIHNEPLVRLGPAGVIQHDVGAWMDTMQANLTAPFLVTRAVVAGMLEQRCRGLVINVSSVSAAGNAGQSAYSAAKAAIDSLTVTWAKELGPAGIRVAGIAPGYIETGSMRDAMGEDAIDLVVGETALRRTGTPSEFCRGIFALIDNGFFHGRVLQLDGGLFL